MGSENSGSLITVTKNLLDNFTKVSNAILKRYLQRKKPHFLVSWYRMIFAFILKPYKIPFLWSAIQTHNIKASDLIFCHFTCKPSWQGSTLLLRSLLLEVEPLVKHAWRAKSFTKTSNRTMPKVTRLTSRWAINLKYRLVVEKLHSWIRSLCLSLNLKLIRLRLRLRQS